MKKLFTTLFLIALALFGAFTAFWFYQAAQMKEEFLADIDEFEQSHHKSARIQFDDLQVKGYPFHFDLVLKNPHLQMLNTKDAVLKSASEAYVKGTVVLGSNILGTKVRVESNGEAHFMVPRPSKEEDSTISEIILDGKVCCELIPSKSVLFSPPETLQNIHLSDLHEIKVIFDNFALMINAPRPETLMEIEKGHITYISDLRPQSRQTVSLSAELVEETHAGVLEKIIRGHVLKDYPTEDIAISGIGKIALQFDSRLEIPQWPVLFEYLLDSPSFNTLPELSIVIDKMNMQGKEIQGANSLDLSIQNEGPDDKTIHFAFKHHSENSSSYNRKFKEALQKSIKAEFNRGIQANNGSKDLPYLKAIRDLINSPDFAKLIPDLPKTQTSELNAKATINSRLDFKEPWQLSINKYVLRSENSGVALQADITQDKDIQGKAALELINYKSLLNNTVGWYNRLAEAMNPLLNNEKGAGVKNLIVITSAQEDAILAFLQRLSDDPDKEGRDLSITANFEDGSNIRIGRLGLFQVLMAWQQLQTQL